MSVSFIATLTAVLMLGDHTIGIFCAAFLRYACCSLSRPVVATTNGRDELDAMRDDGDRGVGHREVDHDIGIRFADDAERHADLADARDQAGVLAQQRMIGRFERGDDLKLRILRGERSNSLAHASRRTVNGKFHRIPI